MASTRLAGTRPSDRWGSIVALLLVSAAAALQALLAPWIGPTIPTLLLPLALVLAAHYGGRRAGLLAMFFGAALIGGRLLRGESAPEIVGTVCFWMVYGGVTALLVGGLNEAHQAAEGATRALARKEEERHRYAARLEEMGRNKDQFMDELAHEFRNHLSPIGMALPILKRGLPPEPRLQRLCSTAERQVGLLTRLIDDLMDSAQIAQGKVALQPTRLDLTELVAHVAEDQQARVEAAGLTLAMNLPPHPVVVEGDPVRLVQVMTNLISNAIKFTDPGGTVTLWVSQLVDSVTAGIGVRDTGIGIEPKELARVFGRFYQAGGAGGRPRGGLGLGLDTVRRLVELHHGTVQVHSRGLGHGAEFVCLLPLLSDSGERRFNGTLRRVQEVVP